MASVNCNIVNPHYETLLKEIDSWAKSDKTRKYLKDPYEAAFRMSDTHFKMPVEDLIYDTGQEVLTKPQVNNFIKSLKNLNNKVATGKIFGNKFAEFFWQSSHYGRKDPVVGSYLNKMQQSSFNFRKNELRDKNRFININKSLMKEAGVAGLVGTGSKGAYKKAQKRLADLDSQLVKALNDGDDLKQERIKKEINTLTTTGELKVFGDFMDVVERGLKNIKKN